MHGAVRPQRSADTRSPATGAPTSGAPQQEPPHPEPYTGSPSTGALRPDGSKGHAPPGRREAGDAGGTGHPDRLPRSAPRGEHRPRLPLNKPAEPGLVEESVKSRRASRAGGPTVPRRRAYRTTVSRRVPVYPFSARIRRKYVPLARSLTSTVCSARPSVRLFTTVRTRRPRTS